MTGATRSRFAPIAANLALTAIALAFIGPMLWMFAAAFNPTAQLSFDVPTRPTLDNFRSVATWEVLFRPLMNSLVLSLTASAVTVTAACFCAYPLSRLKLRFGQLFLYLILIASGLPVIALNHLPDVPHVHTNSISPTTPWPPRSVLVRHEPALRHLAGQELDRRRADGFGGGGADRRRQHLADDHTGWWCP